MLATARPLGLAQPRTRDTDWLGGSHRHTKHVGHFIVATQLEQNLTQAFTGDTKCLKLMCQQCFMRIHSKVQNRRVTSEIRVSFHMVCPPKG
jgi:hypothetical protein